MKFTLEIELGNDAMRTAADVDKALRYAGTDLNNIPRSGDKGIIRDVNGKTVGKWEVIADVQNH